MTTNPMLSVEELDAFEHYVRTLPADWVTRKIGLKVIAAARSIEASSSTGEDGNPYKGVTDQNSAEIEARLVEQAPPPAPGRDEGAAPEERNHAYEMRQEQARKIQPEPADEVDGVRNAFEEWAEADNWNLQAQEFEERTPNNNHYYADDSANHAYIGWCAASREAAALIQRLTTERDALRAQVDRFAGGVLYEQKRNQEARAENEALKKALARLIATAQLLYQNAEGCATNHHALDFEQQGLPGWLFDCENEIASARAALAGGK